MWSLSKLNSFRGGNRQQFIDMVDRCKAVGVNIFVDAVINHMSGLDSEGNKRTLIACCEFYIPFNTKNIFVNVVFDISLFFFEK